MASPGKGLRLRTRPGHPDFLDLDWDTPLDRWQDERLVEATRGAHRHVVRFVAYDEARYALKELPPRLATREYEMLRRSALQGLPVVEAVGVVDRSQMRDADSAALEDVLITRYLDYSLPSGALFTRPRPSTEGAEETRVLHERMLEAVAMLLVRLHLLGFYWGDCSLSNTLFRRDAGALAAYIVDLETAEHHRELTDGQRHADLEIARTNVAGGLMDLRAQLALPVDPDPVDAADALAARYAQVWGELTSEEVIGRDERHRIAERLGRLNELGFSVDEVEVESHPDEALRLRTSVTEQGHHRRRLRSLTGLDAQENQARRLLDDLGDFRRALERESGGPVPEGVAAHRWLTEVLEPVVTAVPEPLRGRLEPFEVFHEVLEHKWFLSQRAGRDVPMDEAITSYLDEVLPSVPDALADEHESARGWIGFG